MTKKDKDKSDFDLGQRVSMHLSKNDVETPFNPNWQGWTAESVEPTYIEERMYDMLRCFGLDMEDDSLKDTPKRVAKMYMYEIFRGLDYRNFPRCMAIENKMKIDEMVLIRNISVWSVCEHHLVPFTGTACVGYIPKKKLMGLSKFNRVVDFFSRRPQVQERLTAQIYHALQYVLETDNIAVVINCVHNCVRLRGVKDHDSSTVTSKMGGAFLTKPEARAEFLKLCR